MLNRKLYIVLILCILFGCKSKEYIIIKDAGLYMNDNCNHQEKIKKSTKRKLCNSNITTSKKTAIHIQIIFHGKENRCIVIVNCNAGFQDPRYLGFYNGTTMKIIKNSFDLELLYKEYLLFCKENNPEDRGKIWDYIDNFSRQELRNHFNKINF